MLSILRKQIRRDRVTLPIWIVGTALLLVVTGNAVVSEYGDADGRAQILAVALATPALLALRGIPNGDSLGSAIHFQSFAFLAVTIGLMNVFLATRHGRAEEQTGRRELVLGTPVSRPAPSVATVILALIANGVFALLAVGGYASAGLSGEGAVLSALALALTGLAFFGVAMVAGELTETSRAANGIGVAAVLVAYALRGAGDALGAADVAQLQLTPAWPSFVSPIGWGQQTLAFTDDRWWPVAALAALAVVATTIALVVHSRRELGASLLPERSGPATARPGLGSSFGLAWRLQWPTICAWAGGTALLGLVLGSLVTAIADANVDNPQIQAILESLGNVHQADLATTLLSAVMVIVGVVAAAAGVQAVLRMREEEADGRLDTVLASPASRVGWYLSFSAVAALTVVIVLVATGAASAIGFLLLDDPDTAGLSFWTAAVQAPAALTLVGIPAMLLAVLPRAAIAVSWAVFGLLVVIGLLGGLLGLPDEVKNISPFSNVPTLPAEEWLPTVVVAVVAVAAAASGALFIRRRDVTT